MTTAVLGVDLAKHVFQLHGIDAHGRAAVSKRVSRAKLPEAVVRLAPRLVATEACCGAHHWARRFRELGCESAPNRDPPGFPAYCFECTGNIGAWVGSDRRRSGSACRLEIAYRFSGLTRDRPGSRFSADSQIAPLATDPDVSFIDVPGPAAGAQVAPQPLLELGGVPLEGGQADSVGEGMRRGTRGCSECLEPR
jgi:hypothetical protein